MSELPNAADHFVNDMQAWHGRVIGLKAVEALRRNHFEAAFFESRSEAVAEISKFVKPGIKAAFGGSQTARQLGLQQLVSKAGGIILDHNDPALSSSEKLEVMRQQQVCDLFICSSNAISLQGELFNIDGNGNRVAAMAFGPRKVLVVAGINKLCADEEAAWERIRSIAAPVNFKRLERPNPCTKTGTCMNCNLPTRGCNIYVATRRRSPLTDISVFIINENLGF